MSTAVLFNPFYDSMKYVISAFCARCHSAAQINIEAIVWQWFTLITLRECPNLRGPPPKAPRSMQSGCNTSMLIAHCSSGCCSLLTNAIEQQSRVQISRPGAVSGSLLMHSSL